MSNAATEAAICNRIDAINPEHELNKALQAFALAKNYVQLLAVDFQFEEYWRDEKPVISLTAIYYLSRKNSGIEIHATALQRETADQHWASMCERFDTLENYFFELTLPLFSLSNAIPLQPISIPKPWGQEIWYTGIEKRGVARVGINGVSIPLPWLLAIAPQRLSDGAQPILLKILDPLPEPVFGDLYFELHQQKQEVYVVTAVDKTAWPDGTGAIRFGFDAKKRADFGDDQRFLADYLNAVSAYRSVRREIDQQIDAIRMRERIGLNDPVDAQTLQRWLREIPIDLQNRECESREAMEAFTALRPLAIGDVVKVPCLLPHSLQHGVRTVEFQTPVYERLILSFGQKVLTQDDWDTARAAELLQLDPPSATSFPQIACGQGWLIEQIVSFDDFEVQRLTLQAGGHASVPFTPAYGLGMVVGASLIINGNIFAPDEAVLLPRAIDVVDINNPNAAAAYFLLALPRAH